jgi:hypothetical protein
MLKIYSGQTRQTKLEIRENYPHLDKVIQCKLHFLSLHNSLIPALFKKQAQNGKVNKKNNKRAKRSADSNDAGLDQFATLLLNIFA